MTVPSNLYQKLASIGLNVNYEGDLLPFCDIEETINTAVKYIPKDQRLLGLLLSWIKIHGNKVNIKRLQIISNKEPNEWLGLLALMQSIAKKISGRRS